MPIDYSLPKPTAGTSRATSPTETEILTDISDTVADVGSRLDTLEGDTTASDHIADATDAHDASAISIADAGGYYTATDVEGALQEVASGTSAQVAYKPGLYYGAPAITLATIAQAQGLLLLTPFRVDQATTFDRIGAEVTTVGEAGSVVRLGIYADSSGYPGALVLDAGTINGASATAQAITISQTLEPGIYWIGGVNQLCPTTPPTLRVQASSSTTAPVGSDVLATATNIGARNGYRQQTVTGALPATFTSTVDTQGSVPRVVLRAA